MTLFIRGAGLIWTGLFSLICLACFVMPYFLPVGWPGWLPLPLRFVGLIIYLIANLAAGVNATLATPTRAHAAAMILCAAIFVFVLIMVLVALGMSHGAHGANWRAHAMIATLVAAGIAGATGIAVFLGGLALRRRRSRQPIPTA